MKIENLDLANKNLMRFIDEIQLIDNENEFLRSFALKINAHIESMKLLQTNKICFPSLLIETRVLIELYIIFYYLNVANESEESCFRALLWQINGQYDRKRIKKNSTSEIEKILVEEIVEIDKLQKKAMKMEYFQNIPPKFRDKIFSDYETWRFDSAFPPNRNIKLISYPSLLEKTDIAPENKDIYGLLSWHIHTNYLSVLQIQQFSEEMSNTAISICNTIAIIVAQHFMKNVCKLKGIKFNHPNPKS